MRRRHDMPFGALPDGEGGARFALWAPAARRVEVVLEAGAGERRVALAAAEDGWFRGGATHAPPGTRYAYAVDGASPVPDPASRFQPRWRDGRIKHLVTWRLLELRRSRPGLFAGAGYAPLAVRGERAGQLCAFARTGEGESLLVVAPRLAARLPRAGSAFPLGERAWGATRLELPAEAPSAWRDVLTGRRVVAPAADPTRHLEVARLLRDLPLAVLASA